MTYEVQQTRWDRIVRRVAGSVGPGSRVSETISELMPVMDIERVPAELLLLGGTQIVFGSSIAGAVAANFSYVLVDNPVDSNNLITVTQAILFSSAAQRLNVSITADTGGTLGARQIRDGRRGTVGTPVGRAEFSNLVVAPALRGSLRIQAGVPFVWEVKNGIAVLPPGFSLQIGSSIVNLDLEANWMWRERPAERSELQF